MEEEIRFKLPPGILPRSERQCVERVAQILTGENLVFENTGGFRWQLGRGSEWWMNQDGGSGEYIIIHRYFPGAQWTQAGMEALRIVLVLLFGIGRFNEEEKSILPTKSK